MAENGKLKIDNKNQFYILPQKYHFLSQDGRISVFREDGKLNVVFYTVRLIGDSDEIIYTSSNEIMGDSKYYTAIKKRENWFYVYWN